MEQLKNWNILRSERSERGGNVKTLLKFSFSSSFPCNISSSILWKIHRLMKLDGCGTSSHCCLTVGKGCTINYSKDSEEFFHRALEVIEEFEKHTSGEEVVTSWTLCGQSNSCLLSVDWNAWYDRNDIAFSICPSFLSLFFFFFIVLLLFLYLYLFCSFFLSPMIRGFELILHTVLCSLQYFFYTNFSI